MPWEKLELPDEEDMRRMDAQYRGKARFLVDESMGEGVAEVLRRGGFNTKFVGDVGLLGRSDEDVFALAWKEDRIIVTHDPDFLDNMRFPPHRNPGVVLIRPGSSGDNQPGLIACLYKAILWGEKHADWFRGLKLDFSSEEFVTLSRQQNRMKILWKKFSDPLVWKDE